MYFVKDNVFYINPVSREYSLVELNIGDKLFDLENPYSKKRILKTEAVLIKAGYMTRVAKNIESKKWSVAIIGKEL